MQDDIPDCSIHCAAIEVAVQGAAIRTALNPSLLGKAGPECSECPICKTAIEIGVLSEEDRSSGLNSNVPRALALKAKLKELVSRRHNLLERPC